MGIARGVKPNRAVNRGDGKPNSEKNVCEVGVKTPRGKNESLNRMPELRSVAVFCANIGENEPIDAQNRGNVPELQCGSDSGDGNHQGATAELCGHATGTAGKQALQPNRPESGRPAIRVII